MMEKRNMQMKIEEKIERRKLMRRLNKIVTLKMLSEKVEVENSEN